MDHTKLYTAYLDSPLGELSNGGPRTVVALTDFLGIIFHMSLLKVKSSCRI